jgi:hypothetical protein
MALPEFRWLFCVQVAATASARRPAVGLTISMSNVICKIIVLAYPLSLRHTDVVLSSLVLVVVVIREVICPPCG